jgi:hypothetical protein
MEEITTTDAACGFTCQFEWIEVSSKLDTLSIE